MAKAQGAFINALWYAGKARAVHQKVSDALFVLGRSELRELRESMYVMPTWLSRFFSPISG
jgi:hypothetical protein